MRELRHSSKLYTAYKVRVQANQALLTTEGGGAAPTLLAAAVALQSVAGEFAGTLAGARCRQLATLVESLSRLAAWRDAIRSAELDADRHVRAARMLAREVTAELAQSPGPDPVAAAAARILRVSDFDEISSLAAVILAIPLPLPLFVEKEARFPIPPAEASENKSISVAFASFELDGARFEDPHTIEPELVHDLKVEARISRWPEGADRLVLEPLSVEPAGTYEVPTFALDRPAEESAPVLSATGRLLIRNPLSLFARPLEFKYRARFEPFRSDISVFVQGQRALRVRCFDPVRSPQSGYVQIDQALVALRDQARRQPAIKDRELHDFLLLLTALGAIAGQALQDNLLPGTWAESDFQREVRRMLRSDRRIGAELEEHPHSAGGITDLSFRGIRLELKVESSETVTADTVERYFQQTIQYVAGSDRRLGALCVLDCSEKTAAPGSAANDLFLHVADPPGSGLPILIGVIIVRGNLRKPSSYSR